MWELKSKPVVPSNRLEREDIVPGKRVLSDPVRTFAYGTDASFYRLNPKYVVKVANEDEVRRMLPLASELRVPVTFRAAGRRRHSRI